MERYRTVITETPLLHADDLCASRIGEGLFRRFYGRDASLFYFGRGALWHGLQSLRLSAADNVLVPAYHCGVEIEAVAMTGAELRYYDVGEDFSVDPAGLEMMVDAGTRAILLVHYFGFPQPVEAVRALCAARGVVLVEDCAQALFSAWQGAPLGTFGDMAVFSQRKTLPLPDGGALLVNTGGTPPSLPAARPSELVALKKGAGMLLRAALGLDPRNELPYPLERMAALFNRRVAKNAGIRYSTGMEIDIDRCSLAMSGISRRIMDRTRIGRVVERRRGNYRRLLAALADPVPGIEVVRESLPDGTCPLFFPVRVRGAGRDNVQERLLRSGVGTFVFGRELHPTLPGERFPVARRLSREILCLPVHQGLGGDDMDRVALELRQAAREAEHADAR